MADTEQLLQKLRLIIGDKKFENIKTAFLKAEQAHKGQTRDNGEPYIVHPLRVCILLADELNIKDPNILIIALLHDTIEDTNLSFEDIESLFGKNIAEKVNLLTKQKDYKNDVEQQKKYFWHLRRAPKKIQILKLADRLDNLRDLATCGDETKIRRYIMDTAYNFLDWAKEKNPYIAGEMEDLIFKYKEQLGDYELY